MKSDEHVFSVLFPAAALSSGSVAHTDACAHTRAPGVCAPFHERTLFL